MNVTRGRSVLGLAKNILRSRAHHVTAIKLHQNTPALLDEKGSNDEDVTHRPLTVNLLPLWRGQKKQGVRYGSAILLALMKEQTKGEFAINFVGDSTLNKDINPDTFLENMRKVAGLLADVGDDMIVNIGGDHAIPMVTIPHMLQKYPNLRVIWIDAHADINSTDTSPSGNFHGMPVYFITNASGESEGKVNLDNFAYFGVREIDEGEEELLKKFNIRNYLKAEIDNKGIDTVVQDLIQRLQLDKNPVHISFDIDGIDPTLVPSTGTKVLGGLSVEHVVHLFREVRKTGNLVSCDVVEFNPLIGTEEDVETTINSIIPVLKTIL